MCLSSLMLWVRIPLWHVIKFVSHAAGRWFSTGTPVSTINKTDRHDITETLLKVALKTIPPIESNLYISL
jgi:hypothetical protein